MFDQIIKYIRSLYPGQEIVPLHAPRFAGREKQYVNDAIDSTYVSSVGEYVIKFEQLMCNLTGSKFAVATVNGTTALHVALKLAGVQAGDAVITQPLSFVATANAIAYCGAKPIFLDVDQDTLGLAPHALQQFLTHKCRMSQGTCYNQDTGRRIAACLPMHTFGHPCRIDALARLCSEHGVPLIEDAAESIGSYYKNQHTGTFGLCGVFSFNGNKTVTCGGGGVMVTDNEKLAGTARHLTTTAKVAHAFEYVHDDIGYNYRLPNLNAALACAQLEQLDLFLEKKRTLAKMYADFFEPLGIGFVTEPENATSNYWLNAILLSDRSQRNAFLDFSHKNGVTTRPVWRLLNKLAPYSDCQTGPLDTAEWLEDRIVNIPSSVID